MLSEEGHTPSMSMGGGKVCAMGKTWGRGGISSATCHQSVGGAQPPKANPGVRKGPP